MCHMHAQRTGRPLTRQLRSSREEAVAPQKQHTRTLLLLLKQGANGLNLTGALPFALSPAPAASDAICMRGPPALHARGAVGCACMLLFRS